VKNSKPPKSAGCQPKLPPGAFGVPGSRAVKALKGERVTPPVIIDPRSFSDPRGGPELVARGGVRVKDNRSVDRR
jgi:hypothetical protein